MRYLLHPFQLTVIAICCVLTAASIILIMVSDPEDDHPAYAAGWVAALVVVVLVCLLGIGRICGYLRPISNNLDTLVSLRRRQVGADLRQITGSGRGDADYSSHHLN